MLPKQASHPRSQSTNLRRKIFEYLAEAQHSCQQLPSRSALRELFGNATDDVDLHLEQLAREGLLCLDKDGGNGIALVPTYTPMPQIEVLGQMAQQFMESEAGVRAGSIALDLRGIGVSLEPGMFAVQVLDDRMTDAGIEYGDIALLINTTPLRGDIVAIEEGDVLVLRRYVVVSGIPHFLAENSTAPDLRPGWQHPMHGVLWGLVRANPCRRHPRKSIGGQKINRPDRVAGRPSIPVQTSASSKANTKAKNVRTRKPAAWPEPPAGIHLNETRSVYRLTETVEAYDTWGPTRPTEQAVKENIL